jgi:hypothetical protein
VSSPNFGDVVQEIVNRPDWSAGNAIAIILSSTNQPTKDVEFCSYEAGYPPWLEITMAQ